MPSGKFDCGAVLRPGGPVHATRAPAMGLVNDVFTADAPDGQGLALAQMAAGLRPAKKRPPALG